MKFLARLYHVAWAVSGFVGVFALTSADFWDQFQLWDIRDLLTLAALLISALGGAFVGLSIGVLIEAYTLMAIGAIRRRRSFPRP